MFGASRLDTRFVDALIRRDPSEFAAVLAEIGDELGIRASIEDRVFRRARLGQAARLGPRLISDGAEP